MPRCGHRVSPYRSISSISQRPIGVPSSAHSGTSMKTIEAEMISHSMPRYRGVYPVVPTTFTASGDLDLGSQKRCVDFMVDAGSTGLCILANFSEQFVLSDAEREVLTSTILEHVKGRVPVIV